MRLSDQRLHLLCYSTVSAGPEDAIRVKKSSTNMDGKNDSMQGPLAPCKVR